MKRKSAIGTPGGRRTPKTLAGKTADDLLGEVRRLRRSRRRPSASPAPSDSGAVENVDKDKDKDKDDVRLRGRESRWLYDFAPVIWMVLDTSAVVLDINPAGCRALGARETFIVGTPLRIWTAEWSRPLLLEHVRRCRTSADPVETELQLKSHDGGTPAVRLYSRRAYFRGRIVFATVALDITEQEWLERARQRAERERDFAETERRAARAAEAAKDRLIAMVSHELRNPLSPALIAASTLAISPDLPAPARDMAAMIKRNIELEARLIDDLLDVARATRGQLDLRPTEVDVHDVVRQAVEACAQAARARAITITVELQAERHVARADAARLQQVFWNLLNNAVKFSHRGGRVVVRSSSDPSGVLTVTVRDFGMGMDAAMLRKLFSPLEEPGIPAAGRAGLGLGLTIARSIIELHGGQIWAASDGPGMGATFEVELTTSREAADTVRAHEAHGAAAPIPMPNVSALHGRILVVEDHEDTGALLATVLTAHGYHVTLAQSLAEGVAALDRPWDAVLSDIGLGDGSGLEIARLISTAGRRPARLVALSGYGSEGDIQASLDAGFDVHLVKPIDVAKLLRVLGDASTGTSDRNRACST